MIQPIDETLGSASFTFRCQNGAVRHRDATRNSCDGCTHGHNHIFRGRIHRSRDDLTGEHGARNTSCCILGAYVGGHAGHRSVNRDSNDEPFADLVEHISRCDRRARSQRPMRLFERQ